MNDKPTIPLAVCVDDYGLHSGIDEAVLRLVSLGRISAVSCMVGAPGWAHDAGVLRAIDPSILDVGLHLDLTEHPVDARMQHSIGGLIAASTLRLLDKARLAAEIEAQFDRFEAGLGRAPAHVDGHQHVHQFPIVRDLLLSAIERRYAGRRPWLRSTRAGEAGGKAATIEALGAAPLARLAGASGYVQNVRLVGVYDFSGDADRYASLLDAWLRGAQAGDLLMCHPATQAPAGDPIGRARVVEYEVLAGDRFAQLLSAHHVRVARLAEAMAA